MIDFITGFIKSIRGNSIVVQAGDFFGLTFFVPDSSLFKKEETVTLYTHMHWNQEQGPTLYGFKSATDRTIFLLITSCQGIGPKIGLAALSQLGAEGFLEAIQSQDAPMLSKVSGIGARKASQIVMQLHDKVTKLLSTGALIHSSETGKQWHTLTQALESLSYSRAEIMSAVSNLKANSAKKDPTFDQLMRQALSFLAK